MSCPQDTTFGFFWVFVAPLASIAALGCIWELIKWTKAKVL